MPLASRAPLDDAGAVKHGGIVLGMDEDVLCRIGSIFIEFLSGIHPAAIEIR